MQFRENLACSRPPGGFTPPLGKILDPPLGVALIMADSGGHPFTLRVTDLF